MKSPIIMHIKASWMIFSGQWASLCQKQSHVVHSNIGHQYFYIIMAIKCHHIIVVIISVLKNDFSLKILFYFIHVYENAGIMPIIVSVSIFSWFFYQLKGLKYKKENCM